MRLRPWIVLLSLAVLPAIVFAEDAQAPLPGWEDLTAEWETLGPPNGTLMISGGTYSPTEFARFLDLAGGRNAPVVLIPTARPEYATQADYRGLDYLKEAGATNVTVLHTMDRKEADSEAFVAPLREARGVWFSGGDQTHLGRAYVYTRVHTEILRLLDRGGVVGGNSAGASIQGSALYGGGKAGLPIGLGLIRNSAIGQHFFRRNRHHGLTPHLLRNADLLGFGIDEWATLVVHGNEIKLVGRSKAAVADARRPGWPGQEPYRCMVPGDRYQMDTRTLVHKQVWPASDYWRNAHRPWSDPAEDWPTWGPPRGRVLLSGGADDAPALQRFVDLSGGPEARIVVVPTASLVEDDPAGPTCAALRALGATNLTVLDAPDRRDAQSVAFTAPLRDASGVWFCDGEPWRLAEAYRHTLFHYELYQLLERGGVVAAEGDSTRALPSRLFRGGYNWDDGLALVREAAADNRLPGGALAKDFAAYLDEHPHASGIALEPGAVVVIEGDACTTGGTGRAVVRDRK